MGLKSFVKGGIAAATGTAGVGTALGLAGAGLDFLGNKSLQNDAQSFSREMAKNKYQWAVRDLNKAGLNEILAFGAPGGMGAGAGTPGTASFRANIPAAVASAVQLRRVKAEVSLLEAQGDKTRNEARINAVGAGAADQLLQLIQPFSKAIGSSAQGYSDLAKFFGRIPGAVRNQRTIAKDILKDPRKYWDSPKHRKKRGPLRIEINKSRSDYQ